MVLYNGRLKVLFFCANVAVAFMNACGATPVTVVPTVGVTATVPVNLPSIASIVPDRDEVARYESIELTIDADAEYTNPYDVRAVTLEGEFTGPDGLRMTVPGFWDGEESWKIRFTPSQEGRWTYSVSIRDARGSSLPSLGEVTVRLSDLHGWIIPGNRFDPAYSGHYLVHHDGTPFYGVGHAEALNIMIDGFDAENGVHLFDAMREADENYVVWWPLYSNSPVSGSYDAYSLGNLKVIDAVVRDAEANGIYLIFTIWDHPQLRDDNHPSWDTGNWDRNGFSKLGSLEDFFVSEEAWAWQANLYRYIIARWGYSRAIGMWQTVSEINGTNALDQTDPWHAKVNTYFFENDPYRHPTTASGSGEVDWPEGHAVMDVPQVHLYDFKDDAVAAGSIVADWTSRMWQRVEKPNWIGEFGVAGGNTHYPELFHNSIWAGLASGAAMTPEMNADISRLAHFVRELPLAEWNPAVLALSSSAADVRAWGLAGEQGGLLWVQDVSLVGRSIEEVRAEMPTRVDIQLQIQGLATGFYAIQPYDTWQGLFLDEIALECPQGGSCAISLPEFTSDMAFKILRR